MKKQRAKPRPRVQRACKACGNDFLAHQWMIDSGNGIYCSRKCYENSRSSPRVERSCKQCGSEFRARQDHVNAGRGIFCSQECFNLDRISKRPKVQCECKQCGSAFLICKYEINQGRGVYCSQACSHKARSRQQHTCKHCGLAFYGRPRSKFCSAKCSGEGRGQPKVQRTCKSCGSEFSIARGKLKFQTGDYCSTKCMGDGQRRPLSVLTCQCCAKVFEAKRKSRIYCSRTCSAKVRSTSVNKNPGRGHVSDKWVLAVILRDKKCVRCGATENLQAHHLKTWRSHPDLRYKVSNGVALCPLCHHAQHPKLPLERFIASGGKKVQHCVVCETAFLVRKKTQRVCSRKCGWKRKAMQRAPA